MELRLDSSRFARIVLRWSWLVVVLAVLAAALAYFTSSALPKEYSSESRLLVGSVRESDLDQQLGYQQTATTLARIATTPFVLDPVAADIGWDGDIADLAAQVSVTHGDDSALIGITATAPDPQEARDIADGVARSLQNLAPVESDEGPLATVVQPATVETSPTSPQVMLNTAVAAALGIGLALVVIIMFAGREPRTSTAAGVGPASGQQPAAYGQQPSAYGQQPAAYGQQRAASPSRDSGWPGQPSGRT
jgi:capsular polysaccharide biosynthesis protein